MRTFFICVFLLTVFALSAQESSPVKKDPLDGCPIFEMPEGDTVWVMKQYFMLIYHRGPNRDQDAETAAKIQAGHLENINKMGKDGFLSIAGPFGDDGELRGILIFNVPDVDKIHELMQGDPAVVHGRLTYEVHPWWGAKGSQLK